MAQSRCVQNDLDACDNEEHPAESTISGDYSPNIDNISRLLDTYNDLDAGDDEQPADTHRDEKHPNRNSAVTTHFIVMPVFQAANAVHDNPLTLQDPSIHKKEDILYPKGDLQSEAITERIVGKYHKPLISEMGFAIEDVNIAVRELLMEGTQDPHADAILEKLVTARSLAVDRKPRHTYIKDLLLENESMKKRANCCQCKIEQKDAVFLPCCHLLMCVTCSYSVSSCPVCGKFINGRIRKF